MTGAAAGAAELPSCPVCCETLGRWGGPATLPCGHNGCLECFQLVQQRNAQCPLCRAPFARDIKLSCNHELEDLIRLATMLFVDESAQRDGWEAFPTQQLTADSYAAELIRGHAKATAATASPGATTSAAAAAAAPAPSLSFGLGLGLGGLGLPGLASLTGRGGGNPNALEDLQDIMNSDPLAAQRRRHSDGGGYGEDGHGWASPSAPVMPDGEADYYSARAAGAAGPRRAAITAGGGAGGGSSSGGGGGGAAVLSLEPPLWLPDSHASECLSCHLPFRPFTRLRHHCRLCGRIYCSACCHKRALLPPKYSVRTPQRVCELCAAVLAPHQQLLAGTLAAAAQPPVQDCPDAVSLRAWLNSPWTSCLGEDVFKAANMLSTFVKAVHLQPETGLPTAALQGAAGLALLTVARVGAGWSFSFGTGLVVARNPDGGWSAPCAIACAGVGWGLQLGGELADVLLVLRSREALSGLCGALGAGVVVGGAAALAVGPLGRHADASVVLSVGSTAAAYGYSVSRGAFVGLSVESTLLMARGAVNRDFYGYAVSPRQLLLEGAVPPPPAAAMLYEGIKALLHRFECRRRLIHSRSSSLPAPQQRALPPPPPPRTAPSAPPPRTEPSALVMPPQASPAQVPFSAPPLLTPLPIAAARAAAGTKDDDDDCTQQLFN